MKTVFEDEGEIRDVDPLAALVTCWRERSTGTLRFERGAASAGFDLDAGDIVAVLSSDPRFETSAILVRAGKLDASAVEGLAAQGGDLALVALQSGILTRREWKWGEKIRGIEILSDVLSWNGGRYRFDSSAHPAAGELRLPVPRLLLELFLRSRDHGFIDHQLGPPEQALVRGERFDEEFATFGLTADAESVVRLIDGHSTAAQIAERAPADAFAVRKLLAALATLGLIHPVPTPSPPRAEPWRDMEPPVPLPAGRDEETSEPDAVVESEPDFPRAPFPDDVAPTTIPLDADVDVPTEEPEADVLEPGSDVAIPEFPADEAIASPLDRFDPTPEIVSERAAESAPAGETGDLWGSPADGSLEPALDPAPPPRGPGPGAFLIWALVILAGAVGALLFVRARAGLNVRRAAAAPTANPASAVTFPPPVTAARSEAGRDRSPLVEAPRPTVTAAAAAVAARPLTASPVARKGSPPPSSAVSASDAASSSRDVWVRRAAKDRKLLDRDRRVQYAIQLELVCEVPSLVEAWRHDRSSSMWLLPVSHGGRDCFRVLWGRYRTQDSARKAKNRVPAYFVTARNRPAVIAVR